MKLAVVIAALGALAGCPTPAPPDPNPPAPVTSCVRACDHVARELACWGASLGACNDVCDRVRDPKFTDCIGTAPSCDAVDRCDTP